MPRFTDEPWDGPAVAASLEADDFCAVCLIDENPAGEKKVKARCWLPTRAAPDRPVNTNALRNCMARIFQVQGASTESKRTAARQLVGLARQAKIEIGSDALLRLAGMRGAHGSS